MREQFDYHHKTYIDLKACYACCQDKYKKTNILPGEGIVGQVYNDGKTPYMKDLPANYTQVKTGLGSAHPRTLLVVPIKLDTKVLGIIELASLHEFEIYQRIFIEKLAEYILIFVFFRNLSAYQLNINTEMLIK